MSAHTKGSAANLRLAAQLKIASEAGHEAIRDLLAEGNTTEAARMSVAIATIDTILKRKMNNDARCN